ncbi:glycosyltransferase family 1 protein [Bacillus salipaludis]|uniref:glycosyltransferase family 4 protein n=1 Tax=Bacillus salipaludis TaxID=2547811 RepID=UPI002E1BB493|nr:glycosyltransferase family 1 protein [Bacillus salipaludis]
MKIAIFTDTLYPDINGVARTFKRFTEYLDDKDISYKIFAPESNQNEHAASRVHRFKSLSFFLYPECRLAFPNLLQIKAELTQFSPDLIHVATPFNLGLAGIHFAKKLNIPLVGSYHTDFDQYLNYYDLQFLSKFLWKYMNWFHRTCVKVFVPSKETFSQLKQHGFTNLEIWPRGVDCQVYHPFYDKNKVRVKYGLSKKYLLTYVGRLAPEKDVSTLLAVSKAIPAEINKDIDWLVVGDGPLREELQEKAPVNMGFTGFLNGEQIAEIYSSTDLFVFPSPTETFGNVVLEALASGTPVIGANAGGVKNIIKPGVTGRLCTPGEIEEFTNAIQELLNRHSLRIQMGWEGRNFAISQNWDTIFENLLTHYSSVIEERKLPKYA